MIAHPAFPQIAIPRARLQEAFHRSLRLQSARPADHVSEWPGPIERRNRRPFFIIPTQNPEGWFLDFSGAWHTVDSLQIPLGADVGDTWVELPGVNLRSIAYTTESRWGQYLDCWSQEQYGAFMLTPRAKASALALVEQQAIDADIDVAIDVLMKRLTPVWFLGRDESGLALRPLTVLHHDGRFFEVRRFPQLGHIYTVVNEESDGQS